MTLTERETKVSIYPSKVQVSYVGEWIFENNYPDLKNNSDHSALNFFHSPSNISSLSLLKGVIFYEPNGSFVSRLISLGNTWKAVQRTPFSRADDTAMIHHLGNLWRFKISVWNSFFVKKAFALCQNSDLHEQDLIWCKYIIVKHLISICYICSATCSLISIVGLCA